MSVPIRSRTTFGREDLELALATVASRLAPHARDTILFENLEKHRWELSFILGSVPHEPAVCDLGGGVGINLLALRELGVSSRLVLIDRFAEYTSDNRMGAWTDIAELVEAAGIEVHAQDFWSDPQLPFDTDTFDVVTCLDVVEHLPGHPLRQLRELRRVVTPQGRCLISGPNAASLSKRIRVALGSNPYSPFHEWTQDTYFEHFREYTRREYEELLRLAAFVDVGSAPSLAVTICRAKHRYHRGVRSWLSPHPYALYGMAAAEALVPNLRHTVYAWGRKEGS